MKQLCNVYALVGEFTLSLVLLKLILVSVGLRKTRGGAVRLAWLSACPQEHDAVAFHRKAADLPYKTRVLEKYVNRSQHMLYISERGGKEGGFIVYVS